jgi:hypothetical protein
MKNNVKIKPTSMIGETGVFWDTGSRGTVRGKIENNNELEIFFSVTCKHMLSNRG